MQRYLILFTLHLLGFQVLAFQQTVQPVKNLSQEDGLLSSAINAIEQDAQGYMWFGTDIGLSRYDGYRFKNYTVSEDSNSLPDIRVEDLKYDKYGRLWVMTENKLCFFIDGKFYARDTLPGQCKNAEITSFTVAENGHLFFTAKDKLIELDSSLNNIIWTSDSIHLDMPLNNPIIQYQDNQGFIWIYNDDNFVLKIRKNEVVAIPLSFTMPSNYPFKTANIDDKYYYTSKEGLIEFEQGEAGIIDVPKSSIRAFSPQEKKFKFPNNKTLQTHLPFLLKDRKNRIWTSGADDSFVVLNMPEDSVPKLPENLVASDIYEDKSGNLWFATRNKGIYFLDASAYSDANALQLFFDQKNVQQIYTSGDYTYAIADNNLYQFDKNQDTFYLQINIPKGINTMASDGKDGILISDQEFLYRYSQDVLSSYDIPDIQTMMVSGDTLYYGTQQQLKQTTFSKLSQSINTSNQILNRNITCIFIDESGHKWIGTETGLYKYIDNKKSIDLDEKSIDFKNEVDIIFGHGVSGIGQTSDGAIWVATKGAGLLALQNDTLSLNINTDNYLSHNYCTGLLIEDDVAWVTTSNDFDKIDSIVLEKKEYYITYLSGKDIPQLNDIQSIGVNEKNIFIGTTKGLLEVNKEHFNTTYQPSKVIITDIFQADGNPLSIDDLMTELDFENNTIQINYAAINYAQQNNIVYKYRMKEIEDWKKTAAASTPVYVLPPGNYTFEVEALSGAWEGSSGITSLQIKVAPPFTQTTAFQILMAILSAIIFVSVYRMYTDSRQKKKLKKLVAQKTSDLKGKVLELERTNDELEEFNYVVAHDLKAPLRSMHSFTQLLTRTDGNQLSTAGKDYIGFIQQSSIRLQTTIDDLLSFSSIDKTEAIETQVDLNDVLDNALDNLQGLIEINQVQIERSPLPKLQANQAHMLQVLQNLISNSIKYQPKGNQPLIKIDCVEKGKDWLFTVQDNGIGIDKQYEDKVFRIFQRLHGDEEYSGTGIGLPIVKKIIESNGGKIWFESKLSKGTSFFFTLPK